MILVTAISVQQLCSEKTLIYYIALTVQPNIVPGEESGPDSYSFIIPFHRVQFPTSTDPTSCKHCSVVTHNCKVVSHSKSVIHSVYTEGNTSWFQLKHIFLIELWIIWQLFLNHVLCSVTLRLSCPVARKLKTDPQMQATDNKNKLALHEKVLSDTQLYTTWE